MSEQNREISPSLGTQVDAEPAATDLARRRKLVRLIGTGVPLVLSLPTRASAQTVSSAYRGAQNDAQEQPALAVNAADGWIRVQGLQYNLIADGSPVYFVNGVYITSTGTTVQANEVSGTGVIVYLAVLFDTNFNPQTAGAVEKGPWPQYAGAGQALHLSSWSSLSPTGTRGPNWVV